MKGPNGLSSEMVKNGSLTNGKQRYKGRVGGRQLVENPQKSKISAETKRLIDKLLLERLPLAGMVRVTGVSKRWLPYYVNAQDDQTPRKIIVSKKSQSRLTIEGDELWSFALTKKNPQWVWLAIDRQTREMVGVAIGDRSSQTARSLWNSLPGVDRQGAVSDTDFWSAYSSIFPTTRHRALGQESGPTNQIERFNCTLRPRISR